ncbi:MAG: hypothetical protein WC799_18200 [Desulfobacteraceae bacterium]
MKAFLTNHLMILGKEWGKKIKKQAENGLKSSKINQWENIYFSVRYIKISGL